MKRVWKIIIAIIVPLLLIFSVFSVYQFHSKPMQLKTTTGSQMTNFIDNLHPNAMENFSVNYLGIKANLSVMADFYYGPAYGDMTSLIVYIAKTGTSGGNSEFLTANISGIDILIGYHNQTTGTRNYTVSLLNGEIFRDASTAGIDSHLLMYEFSVGHPFPITDHEKVSYTLNITVTPELVLIFPYYLSLTPVSFSTNYTGG